MTVIDSSMASERETQGIVLHKVRWSTYEALLADLGNRRFRHVCDRGTLEIMAPLQSHERIKTLLGRFLETLTFELDLPMMSLGSTTMRRRDRRRGIEPDECYYIASEKAVRGKEIDFSRDPRPILRWRWTSPAARSEGSACTRRWVSPRCGGGTARPS
jgi:Uma2 family endonuclease